MVKTCLQAAQAAAEEGRSLEVIDLRSLSPLDEEAILGSVRRTGRAVVVHEASTFLGMGAEVSALIAEQAFFQLEAPVLRVGGYNSPYPPAASRRSSSPTSTECSMPSTVAHDLRGVLQMALREFKPPRSRRGAHRGRDRHVARQPGDTVKVNDVVVEVETAKSLVELPLPFAGTVAMLHVAGGRHRRGRHPDHHHRRPGVCRVTR